MNVEFLEALKDLEKERNISADIILDAIDAALVSAIKRILVPLKMSALRLTVKPVIFMFTLVKQL